MQVGAADTDPLDAHEHLALPRHRLGLLVGAEDSGGLAGDGQHVCASRTVWVRPGFAQMMEGANAGGKDETNPASRGRLTRCPEG